MKAEIAYRLTFQEYPDVVNIEQMCQMLAIPVDSAVLPVCRSCPWFTAAFSRSFPFGKS